MLTLRDLQSSETFVVHPEGAIIGRDGGENDIAVRDKSVSKKHAKLYEKGGKWFLEDLQSANGTYIDDRRISKATPIQVGLAFSLSNYQFEVVEIGGDTFGDAAQPATRVGSRPNMDMSEAADGGEWMPEETAPPPRGGKVGGKSGGSARKPVGSVSKSRGGSGEEPEKKAFGDVIAIFPTALAHYIATVPLLLMNPIGTVRKSIEDQKFGAMGPIELIGWGVPGAIVGAVLIVVCTLLAGIVGIVRNFSVDAAIAVVTSTIGAAVITPIIYAVMFVVLAFLWHPVMGWVIRFLKGESDYVSRSNYYVIYVAAMIIQAGVAAIAALLTALISLIPVAVAVRFLGIVPALVTSLGGVFILYVAWQWLKFFQVVKWFQMLLMIGTIALTGLGLFGAVMGAVSGGGAGGMMVAAGGGTAGTVPTPGKTAVAKATPMATAAASGDDDDDSAIADDDDDSKSAPTQVAKATPAPTAVRVAASGSYGQFVQKRDAVEKAIGDDPTILKRDKLLEQYYRQYHREVAAVKRAHPIRNQAEAVVEQRLIEAEIYEKTAKIVDQLYARIPRAK